MVKGVLIEAMVTVFGTMDCCFHKQENNYQHYMHFVAVTLDKLKLHFMVVPLNSKVRCLLKIFCRFSVYP